MHVHNLTVKKFETKRDKEQRLRRIEKKKLKGIATASDAEQVPHLWEARTRRRERPSVKAATPSPAPMSAPKSASGLFTTVRPIIPVERFRPLPTATEKRPNFKVG